ncbi:hypothetical protein GBAR_LOCUS26129 [Geodia barretti]|uniref:Uncharacterized protein n=1 Tax=Geodia barretti TaxID=519541 RepID=A0AA35THY8_GEOBA|nr:hypothetical protein GBAR_LOCUS26129 [Geodia barretti]
MLMDGLEFSLGDYTLNMGATITLKEHPDLKTRELVYKNIYSSRGAPGFGVMQTLMMPMSQLAFNSYTKVQVENVTLDVNIEDKRRTASIQSLRMDKLRYRPGDTVEVEITLQPYFETPIVQTGTITIPKDVPEGVVTLLATNANFHESWQRNRAPLNFATKHQPISRIVGKRGENNSEIIMELFVLNRDSLFRVKNSHICRLQSCPS